MPYTAPVSPPAIKPASDAATLDGSADDDGIDLDLDISVPGEFQEAPISPMEGQCGHRPLPGNGR